MRVLRYGLVTTMVMALFQAYLGAEELVRSRVAILAMHEPREVSYYEDLRRSVYERWSLRIIRGIDRFTGLRMDGNDWTFRLVALGLLALVTALLFWGFTTPRRRTLAYSFSFGLFVTMLGWIGLYSGIASLNQYDMRGAHLVQKVLDVTTAWGLETDVYWEWEPFKKQWDDPKTLPYTVVCWLGVPLGADELQMEGWLTHHKEQRILQFCLGAQLPSLFHAPLFGNTDPQLDWTPNSARSVCEKQSAYERFAVWQIPQENFYVKTVAWHNNLLLYGSSEAKSSDIERWLANGLNQLGHPWIQLNTQGLVALRCDDPGSALNAYLESWRFPCLSAERWNEVDQTLGKFSARMSVGYVPAWMDDGEAQRGELTVDGKAIDVRKAGKVYPSAKVHYRPTGNASAYNLEAQAQALKNAHHIELELHGFSHITPETERWNLSSSKYENSDWYREFLGTEQRPFAQRSDLVQKDLLQKGRQWFFDAFNQWPSSLIPPGHALSWDTAEIAFREGFTVLCDRHLVFNAHGQVRRSRLLYSMEMSDEIPSHLNSAHGLPAVLYLHDRDLYREKPTWLAEQLTRWQGAGVKKFVSLRTWANLWLASPKVSCTAQSLILESEAWPESLSHRVMTEERANVLLNLPAGKQLGPLPEGLSLEGTNQLSWAIHGQAMRWEIPWQRSEHEQ